MNQAIEIIRENLTTSEAMEIRRQERAAGRLVNVNRLHAQLVEITIIHPDRAIDVTPTRGRVGGLLAG